MLFRLTLFFLFTSPVWPTYAGLKIGNLPIINMHRIVGIVFTTVILSNVLLSRAWLIQAVNRLRPIRGPIYIVICYYSWRLLSVLASQNIPYSLFLIVIDILLQFVIFISVVLSFNDSDDVKSGLKAILFGAAMVVILGLIEYISEQNIFVNVVPNSSKNIEFIASAIEEKIRDNYRVQVAFMHPLVLAEYLIMVIPISALFMFDRIFIIRFCSVFVFWGGIIVLFSTGSRSGVVVLGVQFIYFLLLLLFDKVRLYRGTDLNASSREVNLHIPASIRGLGLNRLNALLSVFFVGVTLVSIVFVSGFYGRDLIIGRGSAETMSTVARIVQLVNGISAVSNKPLLGHGPGFAPEYVGVENIASGRLTLDNYYLTVVVESGIPALVLLIMTLVSFYRYSRRYVFSNALLTTHAINLISCSIVGFIVFSFILSTYEVFGIVFAIFGMVLVLYRSKVTSSFIN